jgi:hypothetical protein
VESQKEEKKRRSTTNDKKKRYRCDLVNTTSLQIEKVKK